MQKISVVVFAQVSHSYVATYIHQNDTWYEFMYRGSSSNQVWSWISTSSWQRTCTITISHLSKACTSEIKSNPNLELVFEIYAYDHSTSSYTWNGRSGFLKACRLLIVNIDNEVFLNEENRTISFDHSKITDLQGYLPFHDEIDFEAWLSKESASISEDAEQGDTDPFIVDKVINKRYNSQKSQYEFLVSWVGYTDETWELHDNIPDNKIDEYENRVNKKEVLTDRPYGLRLTRKQTKKDGYIKTF